MDEISSTTRGRGQIPSYNITRRQDKSCQFDPPVGSRSLANALVYKYPLEHDLESQIRRALLDFWDSKDNMSTTTTATATATAILTTKDSKTEASHQEVKTGKPTKLKRKRSAFTNIKRKKVAEVRRRGACGPHREKKIECTCARPQTPIPETSIKSAATSELLLPESIVEGTDNDFLSILQGATWNDILSSVPEGYYPSNESLFAI